MDSVNISELRANLLKYLEKASTGIQISVTSNGKLLATIGPPAEQKETARAQLMTLAETARVYDVTSPLGLPWDATE